MSKLHRLVEEGVIDEVLGRLKSGKEADVWLVQHAGNVLAAKIYKERHVRNFKNNAGYKEGRLVRNSRTQRAMNRGSRFGQAAAEEAWKSAEADALYKLHAAGVRVPTPVMFYEGVLLMELVVDSEGAPAPRLIDAEVTHENARLLYEDLRAQTIKMLCADVIHGDLSPYNILMGASGPTLIDFPQIIAAAHNSQSEQFLRRDLNNIRQHLSAYDPALIQCASDVNDIWRAYSRRELHPEFVPTGIAPPTENRPQGHRRPVHRKQEQRHPQDNSPKSSGRPSQSPRVDVGREPLQGRGPSSLSKRPGGRRPGPRLPEVTYRAVPGVSSGRGPVPQAMSPSASPTGTESGQAPEISPPKRRRRRRWRP